MKAKEIIDKVNNGEKVVIRSDNVPMFYAALQTLKLKFSCDIIVNGDWSSIELPSGTLLDSENNKNQSL